MLTPRYLAECSDDLVRLLGELDESIMQDFVRRLVKTGHVTDSAKWQAQQMMEAGALYDDIVAEAAKLTGRTENAVRELFREACLKSVAYDINICRAAGLSPLPLSASPAATQVLLSGMEKTKGMLDNLTMTTANGAQRAFIEAATLAEMQVESGAFDYVTAIRNAVRTASSSGAWVLYPTGARSRLDTATRRAVLTGVNQTAAALTLAYADDMDCDLVETTAHMGARPEHVVWQGQVFSRSGKSRRYPDFVTATGYGTGPGLCGWNCRHSFYMFFEGIDERAYSRAQLDEYANAKVRVNGKEMPYYEATQRQRAMERRVRDTRRELAGLDGGIKAAPDEAVKNALQQDFDSAAARLKRQEAALKDFARQTGLALDTSRVQVQGFGRSTSAKAVWAAKRGRTAGAEQKKLSGPLDVLEEYLRTATPGKGAIIFGEGYNRTTHAAEIKIAQWLHDTLGGDIVLLNESNIKGQKMPDYLWRDFLWELKNVSSVNAADQALRQAMKQIEKKPGGVILEISDKTVASEEFYVQLSRRFQRGKLDKFDMLVLYGGNLISARRYKK